jgi:hypothetical protein
MIDLGPSGKWRTRSGYISQGEGKPMIEKEKFMSVKNKHALRWQAAAHAVQSGVMMEQTIRADPTSPKHLRTGINCAMADHAGLAKLLISKGLFTEEEYFEAIAGAMEDEKRRYEELLSEYYGRKITLA